MKPRIQLAVSIDTEEDNWLPTREGIGVENIQRLGAHHTFLRELGLRPTYFVDYAVADDRAAARVIGEIDAEGGGEIGGHLHPWHTPPMDEALVPRHSMMKNLPGALQQAKLESLAAALERVLGRRPTSFRAGRFGLGTESVAALAETGFEVDSSVTPDVSWVDFDDGPDYGGAPRHCYRLAPGVDPAQASARGPITEVPISTGFTRRPFGWRHRLQRTLESGPLRGLPLARLSTATGLTRDVFGGPETETLADLLALSRALVAEGASHLMLVWHSPTLLPGCSPFTPDEAAVRAFHELIADYVEGLADFVEIEPATVSEIATRWIAAEERAA